jgi:hypothetical protein
LAIVALAVLAFAPAASASPKTLVGAFGSSGSDAGQIGGNPAGLAINTTGNGGVPAGSIYAVDPSNARVDVFNRAGAGATFERAFGADVGGAGVNVCTSSCVAGTSGIAAGQFSAGGAVAIAIDQSNGIVYVSDQVNRRINVFSATGTFQGAFGWGAETGAEAFQYCTGACHAPGAFPPGAGNVPGGQFSSQITGLAADGSGRVYVANGFSRRVEVFTPTIAGGVVTAVAFTRAFGWGVLDGAGEFQVCNAPSVCHAPVNHESQGSPPLGLFGSDSPTDVAVDPAGDAYVLDRNNSRIQKFDTTSQPVPASGFDSSAVVGPGSSPTVRPEISSPSGLAFDPAANHLYLKGNGVSSSKPRVAELTSAGSAVALHGTGLKTASFFSGLAVAPASLGGNIYVSTEGEGKIDVLNEGPEIDPLTTYTGTTATFEGSVLSEGSPVTYHFEYSPDGTTWTDVPASDVNVPATPGRVAVSQSVSGLPTSQHYQVRLVQTMPVTGFSATSEEVSFYTRGSLLSNTAIEWSSITPTSATVTADVNPNGEATTYQFEYVTRAQFEASGFSGAAAAPASPEAIGSGEEAVAVTQQLSGLSPVTTYYFRVSATNAASTAIGPELSFSTYAVEPSFGPCPNDALRTAGPTSNLPDCRAYEQVSPVDKLGGKVYWSSQSAPSTQASPDGERITFPDNNGLPTSGGSNSIVSNLYLASRANGAWSTDGLLPRTEPSGFASVLGWSEALTLSAGYATKPRGLYLRDASGNQRLALPGAREPSPVGFAGEAFLFESEQALAPGAVEGKPNLYELEGEEVTLLGRVPAFPATSCDDEAGPACTDPAQGSIAGPYNWQQAGGARLGEGGASDGYLVQRAVSADGSRVFFTEAGTGRLFVREGGAKTVQISASQRTTPDPNGEKAAAFATASANGSIAYFLSCEKLTDDSTAVSTAAERACSGTSKQGMDLYAWDTSSGQLTDLTVDHEAGDAFGAQVVGVLGAGADGSDLYFAANGVLGAGATPGNCQATNAAGASGSCNVYLAHEGTTTFVGRVEASTHDWIAQEGSGEAQSRVSADGALLYLKNSAGNNLDFYRYSPAEGAPSCASCDPTGAPRTGLPTLQAKGAPNAGADHVNLHFQTRNLSANGKRVFFLSPDRLVPADVNGEQSCPEVGIGGTVKTLACTDPYEWEAPGEGSCEEGGPAYYPSNGGCLYLLSSGTSPEPSLFGDASSNGDSAFIFSGEQLVPQDTDQLTDVYDVRVDGGLASQHPSQPLVCEGEACRGTGTTAPQGQGAGTAVFQGPGNPTPKQAEKKAHRKKHKKRHAKQHHHAKRNGGAK